MENSIIMTCLFAHTCSSLPDLLAPSPEQSFTNNNNNNNNNNNHNNNNNNNK